MKQTVYLLIIVVLLSCQNKQKDYYDTGELQSEYSLNDEGNYHGEKRLYYKNGQLHEITHYVDGILQGDAVRYDSLGNILVKGKFLDGEKHGKVMNYLPNGKMSNYITYNTGKEHGWTRTFDENENLTYERLSRNDTILYSKNFKTDSLFRHYKVIPLELIIKLGKVANVQVEVYGPKEKESKIIHSLYNINGKEPMRRDTIPLKADTTNITVTNLNDNSSYYLEVEVFINSKERYFQVITIHVGNAAEKKA
jgi:hypothetical protein